MDTNDATHLSMIGGKYNFANKKLFHTMYSMNLSEASTCCLMERVRYPIKFFIDIDRCTDTNVLSIVKALSTECVVCFNGKDGYHLIFPTVIMQSKEEAIDHMKTWCDSPLFPYMDASVYATGLRMIGACKSKTVKRIYNPICWIHPNGDRYDSSSAYQPNMVWLQACGIQTAESKSAPQRSVSVPCHSHTMSFAWLDAQYSNVPVYRCDRTNHRYMRVLTYEKYCTNVGRCHTNQYVYFVIDCQQKTVTQRCFGCKHGCNKYKSKSVKVPIKTFYGLYNS